uniref:Uncharacterized protein n=1 Tax=Vitis vinifera TaxID=29760 RepID=A5AJ24_VITVI|nr:hypothetical protein VITISV_007140 [Vitis vinifera]
MVKLVIDGKGKLDHLTDEVKKLANNDLRLKSWRFKNYMVIAWLINLMESEVFLEIGREKSHRRVMLQRQEPRTNPETESLALIARGLVADVDKRNFKRGEKPWCDHCKKPWHTRETCRKLHGKPPNWKKKNGGDGYVFQVSNEDQGNQVFSDKLPFTKKQIDSLCKLFQSSSLIVNPSSSCSLAQKGKTISSAKQNEGLYFFEDGFELKGQAQSTCFKSLSVASKNKIML